MVTLRATPNLHNWRPADLVETAVSWKQAVSSQDKPTCLIFSRQNTTPLEHDLDQIENIEKGGYLLKANESPSLSIIASGSEVQLALDASAELQKNGVDANVVSMPCLDVFLEQSAEYQNSVLGKNMPTLVVEMAHPDLSLIHI